MDTPPGSPEPPAAPHKRARRSKLQIIIAILAVLLAFVLLMLILARPPAEGVVWLTPQQMNRLTQPGPLTQLKWKLMALTGPLQRWYRLRRQSVFVGSNLLKLSEAAAKQTGLGPPTALGTNGVRAWILSPGELDGFRQRLKAIPGASIESSPRITTGDGGQARASMGSTISVAGKPVFAGLVVDLNPKIARNCVRLLIAVTSTGPANSPSNQPPVIRTNLALTCQAWLTNACGLVVDGGNARDEDGNGWWFIISPTILDAKGNPIKP